jgi:hypothetical protein
VASGNVAANEQRAQIRAFKSSRLGSTYIGRGVRATYWPCGKSFMVHLATPGRTYRERWQTRADAVDAIGSWIDAEQGGRYIIDNDVAHANAQVSA